MNPFEYLNNKKNLLVEAAKNELGKNGLWEICSVITEAINQGISELDLKMVSNFGDIKKDRANKIMPHAQKILIEYRENLQKNSGLSQDNVEIISRKSQDFGASNPHGSTQACAGEVVVVVGNKNINKTTPTTGDEYVGIVQLGYEYILSSGNTNLQNFGWVQGFLTTRFQEASVSHPNFSQSDLLSVWKIACDSAASKGASSANWYLKAWNGELNRYKKDTNYPKLVGPTRLERLMASTHIINRWDKKVLKVSELRLDNHKQLWDGYEMLEITEFDPYQEEALA